MIGARGKVRRARRDFVVALMWSRNYPAEEMVRIGTGGSAEVRKWGQRKPRELEETKKRKETRYLKGREAESMVQHGRSSQLPLFIPATAGLVIRRGTNLRDRGDLHRFEHMPGEGHTVLNIQTSLACPRAHLHEPLTAQCGTAERRVHVQKLVVEPATGENE
jgi:hypothetical protein